LAYHTCSKELAEIATRAQPGWLVLYPRGKSRLRSGVDHECWPAGSEEQLLQEVRQAYKGKVVADHDLEIY
jgi:ribonuclease BN (tRNA processing enzyme)